MIAPFALLLVALVPVPARSQASPVWHWEGSVRGFAGGTKSAMEGGSDLGGFSYAGSVYDLDRRIVFDPSLNLMAGARFERISLRHSPSAALPDHLQSASARLGAEWLIDRRSWLFVDARPGFYGDDELSGDDFNAPVAVSYNRLIAPGFRALGGVSIDRFRSRLPVAPFLGAVLRASPRWNLHLTLPRIRGEYRAVWTPETVVDLFAGMAIDGGTYRVSRELGRRRGRHAVGGQVLTFTTQRAEAGLRWLSRGMTAELAMGWDFVRRLDYKRPGIAYDSDGAAFLAASASARF